MPYISKSNASRIIRTIDFKTEVNFKGRIYPKEIEVFNKKDRSHFLALAELYENPESFVKKKYSQIKNVDTLNYVFEGTQPAYHASNECTRLNSVFQNFKLPVEIINKGKEEITRFRNWFKDNKGLLDKPDVFAMRLQSAFGILNSLHSVEYNPSGIHEIDNLNLEELEKQIEALLKKIDDYYDNSDSRKKYVINIYKKRTSQAYLPNPISDNKTGYSDEALKDF